MGRDIGLVYDKLQDEKQVEKMIANLSAGLVEKYNPPKWIAGVETQGLTWLLDIILGRMAGLERNKPAQLLSPDAQQGLQSYMEGPLLEQIRVENKQSIPSDITFIFGHTHKPFSQDMSFTGYPRWMKVYNSGGWVVDTVQREPIYGAAVILIDETLQAISLRLYNQAASAGGYAVRVEESTHAGVASSPFYDRINALVKPSSEPWKTFSATVAEAVDIHAWVLQTKINL